jgi:hypothetical protein
MPISLPGKSKSANIKARRTFIGHAAGKIILYCGWVTGIILLALLCLPTLGWAQEELPEVPPQPKKVISKKDQDPRALGLVQLSSNGKATLVPITIRIDGKFHDAASYKANPVPMALESGTVYEGERSGTSVGLFTVNGALRSKAANAVTPWLGTGMWLPAGTDVPKTAMKAESVPRGIETTDQPPRLTKNETAPQETAKAGTPPSPPAAPTSSAPPSSEPPPSKPSPESKPSAPSQPSQGSTTPPPSDQTNNQAGDANRPRLRRGKPTQPLPADEDVPGYSKPGSAGTAGKNPTPTPATPAEIVAAKASVQMYPAISAVGGPDPRSYAFQWLKGEEEERRKQMLDLAKEQLRLYLSHQAKGSIAGVPAGLKNTPTGRRQPSKAPDPVLENVQFRTFDLWANNQPVLILSAEAHLPPPSAMSAAPMANGPTDPDYTITLVARTDIYNNLHKLYAGVTDKYHLDVTPQLELIDAVDADGDGRGELLFRETSDAGSGYVIYRATADTLWKLYDSLNPE